MTGPFHQELLSRFGPEGILACACGRQHRVGVREILVGQGALEASAEPLARRHGPAPALWVLSDENTEAAAGARWKAAVRSGRVGERVLPGRPRPVPTEELVAQLAGEARAAAPDLVVAIGSGVISDLGKAVSHAIGVPNWCVATAPSVDAYTSATSAIRVGGYHQALPSAPSQVVVCDLEVLRRAPRLLFLSGLGDLLAKYLAHLDWTLSHLVTGEHLCEPLAAVALRSARQAIEAARQADRDPLAASASLIDAALVSGLAMQAMGSSRPAAAAEHTIAHFWEMAGAVTVEAHDLHGLLVGAASKLVLRGYAAFYPRLAARSPDPAARRAALAREPRWEETLPAEMAPFRGKIAGELGGRAPAAQTVEARLAALGRARDGIVRLASGLLGELGGAVEALAAMGFPFDPDALGIAEPFLTLGVRHVRLLRNRYTTFDLAHELGAEEELLAPILGQRWGGASLP